MKISNVFLLFIPLFLVGCSTERHARATQQTAIGGGFVAMGTLGLAGSAVGAAGVAVAAASSPDSTGLIQASLLSIGVSAGVSAALTGAGFLMMSMAEPDLFVGPEQDVPVPLRSPKAESESDAEDVWGRGGPPRRQAERPVRVSKKTSEPRNELHLVSMSDRVQLGLRSDSVIIRLPEIGVVRSEGCGHATITQGSRSVIALAYDPIPSSFRLANQSIQLTCDDFLPVVTACSMTFELSLKECRSIKSALERDR